MILSGAFCLFNKENVRLIIAELLERAVIDALSVFITDARAKPC